jgi:glycosyltransferase involved in cell wall biosynthesis
MKSALRIVVSGLAATFPLGGVFWSYLQYALGLRRMGHDVLYSEDAGVWCYDPRAHMFVEDGERNATYLGRAIAKLDPDLANRWFFRDATGKTYGRRWSDVVSFCRSADLLIHVSGSLVTREEYFTAATTVLIDTDPLYTQSGMFTGAPEEVRAGLDWAHQHDIFFTLAENIGAPDCKIPTGPFNWIPTRQPVVLDCFERAAIPVTSRRNVLTTVASWEPKEKGPVVDGVKYAGKSTEFERFIDLPSRSMLPLEVGLSGPAPTEQLRAHGWKLRDGYEVSRDPYVYRDYLASSIGELSLAKNAYVGTRSGWFSDRTACYLALGVPAIVQDTGFCRAIPTGEGLLTFTTLEQAADAIERVARDPNRHAEAARAIAEEHFNSDKVLGRLIDEAQKARPRTLG